MSRLGGARDDHGPRSSHSAAIHGGFGVTTLAPGFTLSQAAQVGRRMRRLERKMKRIFDAETLPVAELRDRSDASRASANFTRCRSRDVIAAVQEDETKNCQNRKKQARRLAPASGRSSPEALRPGPLEVRRPRSKPQGLASANSRVCTNSCASHGSRYCDA